ncbi:hypothetical protein ACIOKD_35610 [Streptomyces sp. NPDC087844]|uniref:hypothetical protein n=1 Tax=Streptomyces sp. NPDC087844 TaxID=3365805 RepID=UPI00382ED225
MTPWLRTLRVTGLLLPLLAGPAFTPYAAAYEPVPAESRAGSRAGEGRERPGRDTPPTDEDGPSTHPDGSESPEGDENQAQEASSAPPEPPARPVDAHEAADRPVRASEPVLQVLPLGTGLVLIGLGLGLAFLALRARRG